VTYTINAEDFARTIYDLATRRHLVELAERLKERAEGADGTADELVSDVVGELSGMATAVPTGISKRALVQRIEDGLKKPVTIHSTGLPTLDAEIGGGLISGKLYGFAARKKVGKTILLGTISHNLNAQKIRHGFLSMEMSAEEIEQRNIAREMRFNSIRFLTRDDPKLSSRVGDYALKVPDCTLFEHKPGVTFDEIRRILARSLQRNIAGWIIDYWQLVGGKAKSDTEEMHLRNVAQFFADFARKENKFIVTAAQVNQEGNTRGGEGLKLACDMYFTLHREKDQAGAWLEMEESRFTTYGNVGDEVEYGLWLHKRGPHFSSDPPPLADSAKPTIDPSTGEVRE
jgi:replicative DNA helicase